MLRVHLSIAKSSHQAPGFIFEIKPNIVVLQLSHLKIIHKKAEPEFSLYIKTI